MPKRSSHLSKKTFHNYPDYHEIIEFTHRVQLRKPFLVVLFGSVARGDFKPDSDADVLVLFDSSDKLEDVYKDCEGTVHPVVKTLAQMEQFIREGEPFYIEMIEDGIPLYDADGMFKKLARLVRAAKRALGLKRTRTGWEWTRAEPVWSGQRAV